MFPSSVHEQHCIPGVLDTQNQPHGHASAPMQRIRRTMRTHIDELLDHHGAWQNVNTLEKLITRVLGKGRRLHGMKHLNIYVEELLLAKAETSLWPETYLHIGQYLGVRDDPKQFLESTMRPKDSETEIRARLKKWFTDLRQQRFGSKTGGDKALQTQNTLHFPELNPNPKRQRIDPQ